MNFTEILQLFTHTRVIENVFNSNNSVENPMDDQRLPEPLMDSFNILQEIDGNSDIIDLEEFKDILTDDDDVVDVNPSILNNRESNDTDLITESKSLLDLNESNVVFRETIIQDKTDMQCIRKTNIIKCEKVFVDSVGEMEIEIPPFSMKQTLQVNETNECKTDSFKTPLPNFQDTFKMFVNASFNKLAHEKTRQRNVLQYVEVNADNLQKHPYEKTGLNIKNIHVMDKKNYDDIILLENRTEIHDSILAKNVMFLDNNKEKDNKFTPKQYDSDCPGYHSSDFEFISESDAELEGLIVNDSKSKPKNKKHKAKTHTAKYRNNNFDLNVVDKNISINYCTRYKIHKHEEERLKEHKIPEGEDYFNLFQGNNEPTLPLHYIMENKSLGATSCMAVEYKGIGFDMRKMRKNDVDDDELKEDAKRSVKKILEMYPFENCKRKRRH